MADQDDRRMGKAERAFWKLAAKLPEDAHVGSLIGRRYEVRVTDLGGKGLAQIDQKVRVVKVVKSPAEALRLAKEHGGGVWDRQLGFMIVEPGSWDLHEKKAGREQRDGRVWGWFGSGNKTEQVSDNGGSSPQRASGSSGWTWTPGQEPYPG